MSSSIRTSFRNKRKADAASSESENEDASSSSSSSSSSCSSRLSSSASSSSSEDEAEIPSLALPSSQTSQSTGPTGEKDKPNASTCETSKTTSKKGVEQTTTEAVSEAKTSGSIRDASPKQHAAVAKTKLPVPVKQDDKKTDDSLKPAQEKSSIFKIKSPKTTEVETVKSSELKAEDSIAGIKKTELKTEEIMKCSKLQKTTADKDGGAEEEKGEASAKSTKLKAKKVTEKIEVAEEADRTKQIGTSENTTKSKAKMLAEKFSIDVAKGEKQTELQEKSLKPKIKKSTEKSAGDNDIKKEESSRETPEETPKPKVKKSVEKISAEDEAKEQNEDEAAEKTKKSKLKKSLEKNADDGDDEGDRFKEASEKPKKSSKSKKALENTEDADTDNQKKTTDEVVTSTKGKKKHAIDAISDADSEMSGSEKISRIPKSKKQVDNSLSVVNDAAVKPEEGSEQSSKSTESRKKKSQGLIVNEEDGEAENRKETTEKLSKSKKSKSSSDEPVAGEACEEKSTKLTESEELSTGLTVKEPVKKRKKSPAKQTADEVSEKISEVAEGSSNSITDKGSNIRSAEAVESDSTKPSVDDTEKQRPKKTTKGSLKSTTSGKDEGTVDESEKKETEVSAAAKESHAANQATDGDAVDKTKEVASVESSCDDKFQTTNKFDLKVRNEPEAEEKEVKSQFIDKVGGDATSTEIAGNVDSLPAAKLISIDIQTKETADNETKAEALQQRLSSAEGVDPAVGLEVKTSEVIQSELTDGGSIAAAGPVVSDSALDIRGQSTTTTTAAEDETDPELDFGLKRESVDDFIQRILSEVRESDKRMKQRAAEGVEGSSTESANNEGVATSDESGDLKGVATSEADQLLGGGDFSTKINRSLALEEITIDGGGGGGGGGGGDEEGRQRSRFADEDDEDSAAGGLANSKYMAAAAARKKRQQQQLEYDDLDDDDLEKRAREAAAEITRRRKLNQDLEMEANDYPPFSRTMYGPRVIRRNIQRYNSGDSEYEERDESFLSKFRRERGGGGGGGGGALPEDAFAPRRREETGEVVRQKARGVRSLVEQQLETVDAVRKASKGLDELDKEILSVKQLSLGHRAHVEALESALDSEARTYESEYQAATEVQRQRKTQPARERKEDFLSLMYGPRPTLLDPSVDASSFSALGSTSTPAVASFMNIYGTSSKVHDGQTNGVSSYDQRPAPDFGFSTNLRGGLKADESKYFLPERRNEAGSRRENGREPPDMSLSGWSPSVSGISVDTSASDEFLNRVRSKYPLTTSSLSGGFGDPSGSSSSRYADSSAGLLGGPSDAQWFSRFARAAVEPVPSRSSAAAAGYNSSPSYFPSDTSTSWRERGTSARRSVAFSDGGGGGSGGGAAEESGGWRRSGSDAFFGGPSAIPSSSSSSSFVTHRSRRS